MCSDGGAPHAYGPGTHNNTAFALILTADYARGNAAFLKLLGDRARAWFGRDRGAVAWEPGGEDFLSPTLTKAACMRTLLPLEEFAQWFGAFLPQMAESELGALFEPAVVSDHSDGKLAHLDGLNLSRAWCMRLLADAALDEPRETVLRQAAERHLQAALPHVSGDYMGEHWLATYAVLAMGEM